MITSAYSDNLTELSIGTKGMPRAISYNHVHTLYCHGNMYMYIYIAEMGVGL